MSNQKWIKIATRNLPFVRMVMIYQSFARYKKVIGWPYGDSLVTFDRGIINLYRRKRDLEKFLAHFLKLKDKQKFLKRIEKRIVSFPVGHGKEFGALYGQFLDFWPLINLPLALDNALRILGYKKTLVREQKQLVRLRRLGADKILRLERSIDRSLKRPSWFMATPDEILKESVDQEKLKKRRKAILLLEKNKVKIITGGRAATWFKIFTEVIERPIIIRGKGVYRGRGKGNVRTVFYKKDLKKLKPGDVLVTPMTEVDFTPYLEKVAAIITDEGGSTCHAAIICREMEKPCIIGTRIATKVLKDGDLVEVDAGKGIVNIIKKR